MQPRPETSSQNRLQTSAPRTNAQKGCHPLGPTENGTNYQEVVAVTKETLTLTKETLPLTPKSSSAGSRERKSTWDSGSAQTNST